MITRAFIAILITLLSASFSNKSKRTFSMDGDGNDSIKVIVRDISSTELRGANFRIRARGFYLLINNDTSKFVCIFTESKQGKVGIHVWYHESLTYHEQLAQLELLLPAARKEFKFDSLHIISVGRLWQMGDLAIQVTKEVRKQSGNIEYLKDHHKAIKWLMNSKLVSDFDNLFKPYSMKVSNLGAEHLYYLSANEYFFQGSKIETPHSEIPKKVLDGEIWIELKTIPQ